MTPSGRGTGGFLATDIAIIVSTYQRPEHLARCLQSIAMQDAVAGRFEVVVTDDGSRDHTLALIAATARRVDYPLTFTTHDHDGFQLARCRNEGVAASTAPYLLFTDGDCLLPRDHVRIHLEERRPGWIAGGDCLRLDEAASQAIDLAAVTDGSFTSRISPRERGRIAWKAQRARAYQWLRVAMRPRLSGNNIGVWRSDLERVNGFDERFVGWGLEDRDLQERLARIGVRVHSVLHRSAPVHLWHPPAPSFARNGEHTMNHDYFLHGDRPTFCRHGLVKHDEADGVVALPARPEAGQQPHIRRRAA
jgi:glycosyltransferase involved in cell wall biosynthesis